MLSQRDTKLAAEIELDNITAVLEEYSNNPTDIENPAAPMGTSAPLMGPPPGEPPPVFIPNQAALGAPPSFAPPLPPLGPIQTYFAQELDALLAKPSQPISSAGIEVVDVVQRSAPVEIVNVVEMTPPVLVARSLQPSFEPSAERPIFNPDEDKSSSIRVAARADVVIPVAPAPEERAPQQAEPAAPIVEAINANQSNPVIRRRPLSPEVERQADVREAPVVLRRISRYRSTMVPGFFSTKVVDLGRENFDSTCDALQQARIDLKNLSFGLGVAAAILAFGAVVVSSVGQGTDDFIAQLQNSSATQSTRNVIIGFSIDTFTTVSLFIIGCLVLASLRASARSNEASDNFLNLHVLPSFDDKDSDQARSVAKPRSN